MRLFLSRSCRICIVCERPFRSFALVCDYCGEDLPQRRGRLFLRCGITGVALLSTAAFATVRGWPVLPAKLTLPGALLVALGVGLALLPPRLCGLAAATRRERLRQASRCYFSGLALTILTALAMLAACTPNPWSLAHAILAMTAILALFAAPLALQIHWHKLAAGFLLAAGLLLSQ